MIASLCGKVQRKTPDHAVIDVGGVGYRVGATARTLDQLPAVGETVTLDIHTIVREDELALYGFLDFKELRIFGLLLGVTGVGPKMALSILGHCYWQDLVQAVEVEDIARLRSIKGIGEKTAKLLVLGLKKKLEEFDAELRSEGNRLKASVRAPGLALAHDAEAALLALGYSRSEIQRTLGQMDLSAQKDLQAVVKRSLQILSGRPVGDPGAPPAGVR